MAPQKRFFNALQWLTLILVSCTGQILTLTKTPKGYTIEGDTVMFECNLQNVAGTQIRWLKGTKELNTDGRFEVEDRRLIINDTKRADTGMYSCHYENETSKITLDVLPSSWIPQCNRTPSSGNIQRGGSYDITCTSIGQENTTLQWLMPDGSGNLSHRTLEDVQLERDGEQVSITYSSIVQDSKSPLLFNCTATIDRLKRNCSVSVNDDARSEIIPFVLVGLMSLIALLLFFVVLYFLFRHRQCRYCREPMLEPNPILDADALQRGSWIPPPVVAIDMTSEDGESVRDSPLTPEMGQPVSQPPDVVPAQEPASDTSPDTDQPREEPGVQPETAPEVEAASVATAPVELKSKKKNLTITKNMDQKFVKPAQTLEKKAVSAPLSSSKPRPTQKREKKKIKPYKEPPVKARMKTPKEPIYAQIKKLNVPSSPVPSNTADIPSTSTGGETSPLRPPTPPPRPPSTDADGDSKETSSTTTGETDSTNNTTQLENDLGQADSKKKRVRHYRKKSEDNRRTSDQGNVGLNIQASKEDTSGGAKASEEAEKDNIPADRIIYAELDFSKNVGLNIKE